MPMTHQRADATLNAALTGAATPHVWLHVGSPGVAGTANVMQLGAANAVRKALTFAAPSNHPTNVERRTLNTSAPNWTGAEVTAGQMASHYTVWSAASAGVPEFAGPLTAVKMVGGDGVNIPIGDLEIAIGVFVRP